MMGQTILSILGTSTPVSEQVAQKLGLVKAAVVCRVFFYQQLKDGVCKASNKSFQESLGISAGAVSSNLKWLLQNEWITNERPLVKGNHPNYYKVTQKFYDLLEQPASEKSRSLGESHVQQVNVDVQQVNGEEDIKEEVKEVLEPDDHLFTELVALLKMPKELMTPKMQRAYEDFIMDLQEMGATGGDITRFGQWWYKNDWRGKQKQKPTLQQVRDSWGDFIQPQQNGKVIKNQDGSYYL